jgi:hypothetical protein
MIKAVHESAKVLGEKTRIEVEDASVDAIAEALLAGATCTTISTMAGAVYAYRVNLDNVDIRLYSYTFVFIGDAKTAKYMGLKYSEYKLQQNT